MINDNQEPVRDYLKKYCNIYKLMEDKFNYSIFEKGYPKKIFFKHFIPSKIHYGPNNKIISFSPKKIEFWKYVNSKNEEIRIKKMFN